MSAKSITVLFFLCYIQHTRTTLPLCLADYVLEESDLGALFQAVQSTRPSTLFFTWVLSCFTTDFLKQLKGKKSDTLLFSFFEHTSGGQWRQKVKTRFNVEIGLTSTAHIFRVWAGILTIYKTYIDKACDNFLDLYFLNFLSLTQETDWECYS